jgi:hypothetical protein
MAPGVTAVYVPERMGSRADFVDGVDELDEEHASTVATIELAVRATVYQGLRMRIENLKVGEEATAPDRES